MDICIVALCCLSPATCIHRTGSMHCISAARPSYSLSVSRHICICYPILGLYICIPSGHQHRYSDWSCSHPARFLGLFCLLPVILFDDAVRGGAGWGSRALDQCQRHLCVARLQQPNAGRDSANFAGFGKPQVSSTICPHKVQVTTPMFGTQN